LEASNRDALAIIDSKNTANAELADELQNQHKKIVKLNQEISSLNQAVQVAQASVSSAKFREDSLQQELELARRNNDWFETELKTKSAEALKTRKEKGARIAELQRLNDDLSSNIESLTRSEQQLRKRLDDAQKKADEALTTVQQLQESAARAEEGFKQELESSKRLVELKDEQTKTHKKRLQEVEIRLEQVKDDAVEEVRSVRQALEKEKEEHAETGRHSQELQTEVDRLQAIMSTQAAHPGSAPQTPRANGSALRAASPFGTPASFRGKATLRATDAIEELYNVKAQLAGERRRNKQLQEELDDLASLLEAKAPEIDEANAEVERLRNEAIQMSEIMEQSYQERDLATKAARKAEAAASKSEAEKGILQAQLRDLSTQVHVLIFNIHANEKGLDQLTEEEALQYERVCRGEVAQDALADMSPTHQFITERFVAFKDIYELQKTNQKLLAATRDLANKMEKDQELAEQQWAAKHHDEVQNLRGTVSTLQDEVRSITVRMKSYMSERDMFRRMLQQKATPAEMQAAVGISGDGGQREVLASIEHNSTVDEGDLVVALRELQTQFDSYRNDQNTDRKAFQDQIERLSGEKSSLQAEIAKIGSQLTLATERYEILQSNFQASQNESRELQRRNQTLSETSAKQDIRTQQVAQELVEVRELQESLRNENANLKAEKTLWKSIQDRLHQDNENLVQEKARLNTLLSSQQSLQNERELGEAETRRRLQNQIDSLTSELTTTKRKLDLEREESKKIQLRKEFDAQQSQKRIDELTTTLGQLKQENVATKTSRDLLQARVDELTIELRSAEERTQRLRPIPTPRAPAADQSGDGDLEARIQELEGEVSELKNSLDLANAHLENAKQQADEYKRLSQDVEEELTNLTASQEQYHEEMDAAIATKDNAIKGLEQRMEAISTELANSTSELNSLRDAQAEIAQKSEEKERMLRDEISRLKEQEERDKEAAKAHLQDLRGQAEIAAQAQQAHDLELLKHAEATKLLQTLRAELNDLKTQSASWRAEAESAKLSLTQSEQSWEERRQQLEQETAEIRSRWDDANAQNKLLHKQLESTNEQIIKIQQSRASAGEATNGNVPASVADAASEGLRELNNYLRREKEILEVQYEIKVQESKRLQQQLEYSQSQLDEARLKLEQERRAYADSSRASMTHKELMEKLNELNIIRESNVTLRNENQRSQAQLSEKTARISTLEAQIQPLEARIAELESNQAFKEAEIKQLQEDRERWQKRTESILKKYGQADPEELEKLKESIDSLTKERDVAKQEHETLQAKIQELETTLETERTGWKTTREKLAEQFKSRYNDARAQRNEAVTEKNELQSRLDAVTQQLAGLEKDLEAARSANLVSEERSNQVQQQPEPSSTAQQEAAPTEAASAQPDAETLQQLENLWQELENVTTQKAAADAELANLRSQLELAIAEKDQALALASQQVTNGGDSVPVALAAPESTGATLSEDERAALQAKMAEAEAKATEAENKAKHLEENMDAIVKQRSEKMKDILNKKLKDSRDAIEKEAQDAKNKLQEDFKLRLEQERAIWQAENTGATQNGAPPSTPAKDSSATQAPPTPTMSTPGGTAIDLANLTDVQTRELLSTNPTVKSIVANNIKKRIDAETKKVREEVEGRIKSEYEQKINTAKEQATALQEKKSALRINMLDRQVKTGLAKLGVVETAANETPQRPVVEVWSIAKDAKPAPPPPAAEQSTPAPQVAAGLPGMSTHNGSQLVRRGSELGQRTNASTVAKPASGEPQAQATQSGIPQPAKVGAPQPSGNTAAPPVANNPFASSTSSLPAQPPIANPFAPQQQSQPGQAASQPARTGIPLPSRGGAAAGRGRGGQGAAGVYQPPGRGGAGQGQQRGGRGGFGASRGGMNPQAGDFQPGQAGNKRPRNDSEAAAGGAGGPKRQRGGGGGGQ
jgi:nucleoprotein TPR